jgi:hypothetical protein
LHSNQPDRSSIIRITSAADSESIAILLEQLGYPGPASAIPGSLLDLRADGRSEAYLAIRNQHVAGLATVQVQARLTRL